MAHSTHPLMKLISGMLGKEVIFKNYYEKTVVSKRPDMSKRILTEKQQDWNWRMKYANAYAQTIYGKKEEHRKERVRLNLPPHKSLYHALVKEFLDKHKHLTLDDMSADLNSLKPNI